MKPENNKGNANSVISELTTVEYNKAYAVGEYVRSLALSISEMMKRGDHTEYAWNSGTKHNTARKEMLDAIHAKAMEAINSLNI